MLNTEAPGMIDWEGVKGRHGELLRPRRIPQVQDLVEGVARRGVRRAFAAPRADAGGGGGFRLVRGALGWGADRLQQNVWQALGWSYVGVAGGFGVLFANSMSGFENPEIVRQVQTLTLPAPDSDPDPDPDPEPESGGFHKPKRRRSWGRGYRLGELPVIKADFTPWNSETVFQVPDRGSTPYPTIFDESQYDSGRRWPNRSYGLGNKVRSEYDPGAPGQLIAQMPPELFRAPLVRDREVVRQAVSYPEPIFDPVFRGNRARTGTQVRAEPVPAAQALVTNDYFQQLSVQELAGTRSTEATQPVLMQPVPQPTPTVVNYVAPAGPGLTTAAGGGGGGGPPRPPQFECAMCARDGFVMGVGLGALAFAF